jgi:hypothetical protein
MSNNHLMIDLETMSTASDAAILSIGIQPFNPEFNSIDESLGILIHVDLQACINAGLRIDASTIMWWMTQNDNARAGLVGREPQLLSQALKKIEEFGRRFHRLPTDWKYLKVWSNGAGFDIPILENAYRRCGFEIPWKFYNVLDVRTMKFMAPEVEAVKPEIAHNALSDAQAQALYVQKCYRYLRLGGGAVAREKQQPPRAAADINITEPQQEGAINPLATLWDACSTHDWFYEMSEDSSVYTTGSREWLNITDLAKKCGPDGVKLMNDWKSSKWKGEKAPPRPI